MLSPLTVNDYTVKDSFAFSNEIRHQNANLLMASLDVESLFTNIPLDETIDICTNSLYANDTIINGIDKENFKKLLTLATKESFFLFNNKFYKQLDGVAMGSPLGPTLANAFLCFYEKQWLQQCPTDCKPSFFRRYVDDIFVLFSSQKQVESFKSFLNSRHPNIKFTSEIEANSQFSFLDVKLERLNSVFVTSVFRKPTFSGIYTNFKSFIPDTYKFGLVFSLLFRCFSIVTNMETFHREVTTVKDLLRKNDFPVPFIDSCIKRFVANKYCPVSEPVSLAPKKEVVIVLPFLGTVSLQTRTRLVKLFSKGPLSCCNLKVIFQSPLRINNMFNFKDKIPKSLLSGVVYKFTCSNCNVTYIGKTIRHLKVRVSEHLSISPLTEKPVTMVSKSAICCHLIGECNVASLNDFSVITSASSNYILEIKESLMIQKEQPRLNKNITSAPLYLY